MSIICAIQFITFLKIDDTWASFILVGKTFSLLHSFRASCRCTPIAILQDFMRRIDIPPGTNAWLSPSESMTE